jgi:ABC-type dipeptide/oligopeptide/nickel transport system ATPase component
MVIVAAAGLGLANAAGIVARGVESRYAIQLSNSAMAPKALAALRKTAGVTRAEPVPEAEMRRTLERWLGPGGLGDELPIPALINVDLAAGANAAAIQRQLDTAAPGAQLVAHQEVVAPLLKSLRVLQWLALALVLLMAAATSAAVVLAARGAFDNVALPLRIAGMDDAEVEGSVREMLAWVGLADRASARPPTLSGGEQQRVAIARAVITQPDLLVADEPTGNVDADMAKRLLHLFTALNRLGTTIVVATHDLGLIAAAPGAQLMRLEGGLLSDPTGTLRNPPNRPAGDGA